MTEDKIDLDAFVRELKDKNKPKPGKKAEASPHKTIEGAKPVRVHKENKEKPARAEKPVPAEKPAKETKPMKVDMKTVMKALRRHDPTAIMSLARTKDGLDALLAAGNNRETISTMIAGGMTAAMKGKGLDTALELMGDATSDAERVGPMRSFLFGYVPSGNELYKSEIEPLKKYGKKDMGAPLDADTVVAAATYIWRWSKGNPKNQLDLTPTLPKDREEAKPEKGVPSIKAPEAKANDAVLTQAGSMLEFSTSAKASELLKLLQDAEKKGGAKLEEAKTIALQGLFNDLKSHDHSFQAYLAMRQKYDTIRAEDDTLRSDRVDPRAGLAAESILGFLNQRANIGAWKIDNLEWDFRALNIELGRKPAANEGTKLPEAQTQLSEALLGCAVYRWRQANPKMDAGAWARPQQPKKIEEQKNTGWMVR